MPISGSFRTAERKSEMSTQRENEKGSKSTKETKRRSWEWCRIYPVDFMRAEDAYDIGALSKLELEVKEKLASSPSPYDELVAKEEEPEKEREAQRIEVLRTKLHELARKAGLSQGQKECFRLLFVERLSIADSAEQMGVSLRRIRLFQQQIESKIKKHLENEDLAERVKAFLEKEGAALKPLAREILTLRYVKKMGLKDIAKHVGRDVSRISRWLEKLSRLIERK